VNDPGRTTTWSRRDDLLGRVWADDITVDEERSAAEPTAGALVSLGFFTGTLRRRAWVWCLAAILGLVIGCGLYLKYPPAYHATATVLLVYDNPDANPAAEVPTEQAVAQSRPVAERVVQQLQLPESVVSFQKTYTVTIATDNVLTFDVGARSSAAAMERASALAAAYLEYRAQYAQTQERLLFAQLHQQYNAAEQRLMMLDTQVNQIPPLQVASLSQKAKYDNLQTQIGQQEQIIAYVTSARSTAMTDTNALMTGSYALDAATALPRSRIKGPTLYFAGGLFGGLAVGIGGVIVAALLSHRLRRRDDVAAAMGAPVRLSVGRLRRRRWPPALRPRAAKRNRDMRRVVGYLQRAVPGSSRGLASLAVVAVDDAQVVAQVVASLATSCASQGKQVVVADLSSEAHLARLLGVREPGVYPVRRNGANLIALLPERDEVAPVGPVPSGASPAVPAQTNTLVTACSSADLLLTLAVLDPAFAGDHLGTWATNAVAVVTAGASSAEKIHSVGEMIRLAGMHLDSVILIGADKRDDSLGVMDPADQSAPINQV